MAPLPTDCYPLTDQQREAKLKAFIDSIGPNAVCDLASRYHNSKPCRIFQDAANGSYNVCFFIEFLDEDTKWVVRIPLLPCIYNVWDKVQNEMATIRYLENNTVIQVPHIHGFGPAEAMENPLGLAYIIFDYIPGRSLDILAFAQESHARKHHFYWQLIDILAELCQQEFDQAGSLMLDQNGGPVPIIGPSLSIQLNELQVEQGEAVPAAKFYSTIDFAFHQYHLLDQKYQLPVSEMSMLTAQLEVFALNDLKGRIFSHINPYDNHGPLLLAHSDLRWSNIIVDEDLNIRGIID